MENFSKRLKIAMKERKMSQADLATKANLDGGTISRYVRGSVKPKAI